ncbi:hypothetical protein GA565_02015 [Rouxiella sp. S1S-2]|uniref:carbapenem self-resistance protein CarG family protein n=1 Tax=Rouxiella sp. S1S-2 TaxID=2653856 RepID=UPI0012643794|nr:hypothetical protein [Rouxiella sp. S1S-2]KAB7894851.1 hypothetical protein GA565_02015 [Rouxiella sp. S1S-2]
MKKRSLGLLLLLSINFSVHAITTTKMKLHDGPNALNITAHGVKGIFFVSTFDNNTSHTSKTLTLFIINKQNRHYIVPVPNNSGFTWYDEVLSAASIKTSGYELHKLGKVLYMITARKILAGKDNGDMFDQLPVKFVQYKLMENHEDPGVPNFYWDYVKSYKTSDKYLNIDEAFEKLNLKAEK